MIMASMRKSVLWAMRMWLASGFAEQPIGQSAIVQKPIAEIGLLRPGPGCYGKYIGVKAQCRRQTLTECGAKQPVPRARSRLKLSFKSFPKRVNEIGGAGRSLDTEQQRPPEFRSLDCSRSDIGRAR